MQEWFADEVNERDGIFTFEWNGTEDKAKLLDQEQDKFVRFKWDHMAKDEFFELSINRSEVTNQTILVIKILPIKKILKTKASFWEYQVKELFHRIGS